MKTFNQVITVEVSVDAIAQQLLNTISDSFPHREMLVETIIGCGLQASNLTYLYNSLNGFTNEINFKIGQEVMCSEMTYQPNHPNKPTNKDYVALGNCVIVDINPYSKQKVLVEYTGYNKLGEEKKETTWVSHSTLSV